MDYKNLFEAVHTIREHCKKTVYGEPCCFAFDGVCKGFDNCRFASKTTDRETGEEVVMECGNPCVGWNIPKPCKWSEADVSMAKALKSAGYVYMRKSSASDYVSAVNRRGGIWDLPGGFFEKAKKGDCIELSLIIEEYENDEIDKAVERCKK